MEDQALETLLARVQKAERHIKVAYGLLALIAVTAIWLSVVVWQTRTSATAKGLNFTEWMLLVQNAIYSLILVSGVIAAIYAYRLYTTSVDTMRIATYHDLSEEWNALYTEIARHQELLPVLKGQRRPGNETEKFEVARSVQMLLTTFDKWVTLNELGCTVSV